MCGITIVRYGEIFLKSEYVKRRMEDMLIEAVKLKLNVPHKIIRKRHRLYIESDDPGKVAKDVSNIFGVTSTSAAVKTAADMSKMAEVSVRWAKQNIKKEDTFAVRASRTGRHEFSSMDIESEVGRKVQEAAKASVNLDNPDKTIFIEVRDEDAFVFDKKIPGVGGLPYGSQGKAVALISRGIDSPAAAWLMMKRGCRIIGVHFSLDSNIEHIMRKLEEHSIHKIKSYNIGFSEVLNEISKSAGKYTCVICKRTMLRIAERIARMEGAHGIVTGDNLGQVASQTLDNLEVVSAASDIPIYRPLIGMDKEEIIGVARKIGTYDLQSTKLCKFVPRKPSTKARSEEIERIEKEIGIEDLIDKILEETSCE